MGLNEALTRTFFLLIPVYRDVARRYLRETSFASRKRSLMGYEESGGAGVILVEEDPSPLVVFPKVNHCEEHP